TQWGGAGMFSFLWQLVVAVQAMNRTFHFALGFGATRRDYFFGTLAALGVTAAGWAIVFGILAAIEDATNGWGLSGHMFASIYYGDDGAIARVWYVFLLMLFFIGLGLVAGAAFVRWQVLGLVAFFTILGLLIIGGLAWIVLTDGWAAVGRFLAQAGFAGVYPLFLIPFAVCVLVGYLALRRATARS
ncbi:MAG: hypothetical protein J7480_08820, partial [Microbacteriaceae bacterium]|nr:hypothetical protein [Microbacteriaceae bacterium]